MSAQDSYGFGEAMQDAVEIKLPPIQPKRIDRNRAEEGRAVAKAEGFHRRAPMKSSAAAPPPESPKPAPAPKAVGRVKLSEAVPRKGQRFDRSARVQLNISAPTDVARAWRELADDVSDKQQWELLEAAVPLLREKLRLG